MRGEKNEAASGLCLFLPLGPRAGKIKGGLGLCSQGLGEAQLNGVTLWEEETPMGHTASVWGPAHPPLAFAPSNTTPGHPKATQLPTDAAHPALVRPAACRVGQRHGLQLHLGTEDPFCWSCKGGAFRTFLALKLVPSSYWASDKPIGDSHPWAGPAPEMGPWAADQGAWACGHPGIHPGAAEKGKATQKHMFPCSVLVGPGTPSTRRQSHTAC